MNGGGFSKNVTFVADMSKLIIIRKISWFLVKVQHMVKMILPWLFYKIHWATKKFCLGFYYNVVNRHVYDSSVDYDSIGVWDISDIHNYLIKKYDIK